MHAIDVIVVVGALLIDWARVFGASVVVRPVPGIISTLLVWCARKRPVKLWLLHCYTFCTYFCYCGVFQLRARHEFFACAGFSIILVSPV